MSNLDDLVELKFSKLVDEERLREVFLELANEKRCAVGLRITNMWSANSSLSHESKIEFTRSPQKSSGNIFPYGNREIEGVDFDLNVDCRYEETGYSGLRFFTTPGYDLEELPKRTIEFIQEMKDYLKTRL